MRPFLQQVADHYYNIGDIQRRCFIFPNRRSMAFFKKWLGEAIVRAEKSGLKPSPVLCPRMLTINDFFFKVGQMCQSDRVSLLLELYECYKELNPKAEPLDEFIFWGDIILGDFNDVDKYLVDPAQLFTNVADYKQIQDNFSYLTETQRKAIEGFISHFNDASGKLTVNLDTENPDVKGRFLQIWNILHRLYLNYNGRLSSKGAAYEGMAYRALAQRLKAEAVGDVFKDIFPEESTFVFVGLNALNECEKTLLRKLRDASRAEFCWDYSGSLIQDLQNRSSFFMSDNIIEFPQAAQWDADGVALPVVNVVSVPSAAGQAKLLPDILDSSEDSAVVLPDENLLKSVLNSIPERITDINVTMGLPMKGSLLFSMMSDISAVQLHAVNRKGVWLFYHRHVWDLFSNPLFKAASDERTQEIISAVKSAAKYYIPMSDLHGSPLMDAVFTPVVADPKSADAGQIHNLAEYQKKVIRTVAPSVADNPEMALELEYAKEYYRSVNLLQEHSLQVLPITYIRLLSQILGSVSVPFRGEPLKGLQIMGPLEMRALDFRNLIIMSSNEGVFPRRSVSSSFIPPELRKGFGLPTYEYQDAVWAYYFYRAISRAENVWMLVDSRTEGLKSGEESRYIKQLEYHFGVPVRRYVVDAGGMCAAEVPEIEKTSDDIEKVKSVALSATAIQNYLACPAKFYYTTVKGLQTEDEVSESLDYGMFGTVFHDVMRAIYTAEKAMDPDFEFDYRGESEQALGGVLTRITREYISSWLDREDDIRDKVKALIVRQLKSVDVSGRNLVVADVIVRYVMKTLQRDLEMLQDSALGYFEILGRELPVYGNFNGQRMKGFIDRIDSFAPGQIRVVDYKTGKVLADDEDITDGNAEDIARKIFEPDIADRPKIALQFYMYDLLIRDCDVAKGRVISNSVYSTAKLFKEAPKTVPMNMVFFEEMSARMAGMLEQIYDPAVPFRRTSDEKVCEYCDFKNICGR